jgi:SAM-dependent methyltransferase
MHERFLDYLADPVTKERLTLRAEQSSGEVIETGSLISSHATYPIVRGIPRFVPFDQDNYARSFGYQWRRWPRLQFEAENKNTAMAGYTRGMWERITGITEAPFKPEDVILDIGCGPGRFTDVVRAKGASAIALDYSQAVEVARRNFNDDDRVCVVQGDALNLPVRSGSLAGAFSIGVLHHTPDPKRGVAQAVQTLREGGWFAVSVYPKRGYYNFPTVQMWRRLFQALWPVTGHYPALAYSYAATYMLRPFGRFPVIRNAIRLPFPSVYLPDIRWSVLDTFDSVTPSFQSGHDGEEVSSWLVSAALEEVVPGDWGSTTFRGRKRNQNR